MTNETKQRYFCPRPDTINTGCFININQKEADFGVLDRPCNQKKMARNKFAILWVSFFIFVAENHSYPAIDCGRPNVPNTEFDEEAPTALHSVVELKCKAGFSRDEVEAEHILCQESGEWTTLPVCKVIDCGEPDVPYSVPYDGEVTYNSKANISCLHGYERMGMNPIVCQETGEWSMLPECKAIDCKEPDVPNSVRYDKDTNFNARANVTCQKGYRKVGKEEPIVCQANGEWSYLPECRARPCDDPPSLENGIINTEDKKYVFNDRVEYECDEGFKMQSSPHLVCGADGNWSQLEAKCVEISCGKPADFRNGTVDFSNAFMRVDATHKYSSEVSYKCDRGFEMYGQNIIRCDENGWTEEPPECNVVNCGEPDVPNSIDLDKNTALNTRAYIRCEEGYKRIGGPDLSVCQEDGTWSNLPQCEAIDCGRPNVPNTDFDEEAPTTLHSVVELKCKAGFSRDEVEAEHILCQESGKWTTLPVCKAIGCGKPNVANSEFDEEAPTAIGSVVQLKCKDSFR